MSDRPIYEHPPVGEPGSQTPNQNVPPGEHPGLVDVRNDPAIRKTTHPDLEPKPKKESPMPPAIMGPRGMRR